MDFAPHPREAVGPRLRCASRRGLQNDLLQLREFTEVCFERAEVNPIDKSVEGERARAQNNPAYPRRLTEYAGCVCERTR